MSEMTFAELTARMVNEGYQHLLFERGPTLLAIYDFRIEISGKVPRTWRVCETERGQILKTYLETRDEAAACAFWYDRVSQMSLFLRGWPTRPQAERA